MADGTSQLIASREFQVFIVCVMWEELTPRYTQLEVSLLSFPQSCLTIGHDIGLTQGLIARPLRSFTQVQKVITIELM